MPVYDDDDDFSGGFDDSKHAHGGKGRHEEESWDFEEDPDDRDVAPDDFTTVRCGHCNKLIFEDAVACPYCKHLQLEEDSYRKPVWFWATVIFCIGAMGGFGALWLLGWMPWQG